MKTQTFLALIVANVLFGFSGSGGLAAEPTLVSYTFTFKEGVDEKGRTFYGDFPHVERAGGSVFTAEEEEKLFVIFKWNKITGTVNPRTLKKESDNRWGFSPPVPKPFGPSIPPTALGSKVSFEKKDLEWKCSVAFKWHATSVQREALKEQVRALLQYRENSKLEFGPEKEEKDTVVLTLKPVAMSAFAKANDLSFDFVPSGTTSGSPEIHTTGLTREQAEALISASGFSVVTLRQGETVESVSIQMIKPGVWGYRPKFAATGASGLLDSMPVYSLHLKGEEMIITGCSFSKVMTRIKVQSEMIKSLGLTPKRKGETINHQTSQYTATFTVPPTAVASPTSRKK